MIKRILVLVLCVGFLFSCTKEEGRGGKGAIKGKIFVQDYNSLDILKEEYYPSEWKVYIIYGDNDFHDDDVLTHIDGSFVFDYLYPGNYTIFAYSKCKTCPGEKEAISVGVTIENDELVSLEDIVLRD